jgi:hypothetical protein
MGQQKQGSVGRKRLRILLAGLGFIGCGLAMALVVFFYGPPYNPAWWGIMAAVLALSAAVPPFLAPTIEWVLDGYRRDSRG